MFKEFDTSTIKLRPLAQRTHDLQLDVVKQIAPVPVINDNFRSVAAAILHAAENGASVILMMGGHVIRSGVQRYIIQMMEEGYISCLAMNGAGMIHDFELALIGATTENVAEYIRDGRFGMWEETGGINDIVKTGAEKDQGIGEAVGMAILNGKFPNKNFSLLANAYRLGILATVHVHLGCDIVHQHPNCCGASYGKTTYKDFLRFTAQVEKLTNGVIMNFGSAVMAPEIFLKALSMARNKAAQTNRSVSNFTSLVCDLKDLPDDLSSTISKKDPLYFFRPFKTMLVRSLSNEGKSYYVKGFHSETIPQLWSAIHQIKKGKNRKNV